MKYQWIFAAAVFMAGCDTAPDFACDVNRTTSDGPSHKCTEIPHAVGTQLATLTASCAEVGGMEVDRCDGGGLGFCTFSQGDGSFELYLYPVGGVTAALAESACVQRAGTWTGN